MDDAALAAELDRHGHALLPGVLGAAQVRALRRASQAVPAPEIAALQAAFYPRLRPIANRWNEALGRTHRHGPALPALQWRHSRLRAGEDQPLRQDSVDARDFALQLVLLLGTPGADFTGGEFVLTEQRPRMQSRPMVLPLQPGDVAVVAVAQRPCDGGNGRYTVQLRQAISRVCSGERLGLTLLFHPGA